MLYNFAWKLLSFPNLGSLKSDCLKIGRFRKRNIALFLILPSSFHSSEFSLANISLSPGVGRTGCFIVIDTQLEKIRNEDQIDVYGHVTCLRAQRQYMVQTEDQYMFIYDAILEAIQTGNTEFRKFEIEDRVSRLRRSDERPGDNRTGLEAEFERLSNVTHSPAKFASAMLPENMPKNRLANIKPC